MESSPNIYVSFSLISSINRLSMKPLHTNRNSSQSSQKIGTIFYSQPRHHIRYVARAGFSERVRRVAQPANNPCEDHVYFMYLSFRFFPFSFREQNVRDLSSVFVRRLLNSNSCACVCGFFFVSFRLCNFFFFGGTFDRTYAILID